MTYQLDREKMDIVERLEKNADTTGKHPHVSQPEHHETQRLAALEVRRLRRLLDKERDDA